MLSFSLLGPALRGLVGHHHHLHSISPLVRHLLARWDVLSLLPCFNYWDCIDIYMYAYVYLYKGVGLLVSFSPPLNFGCCMTR